MERSVRLAMKPLLKVGGTGAALLLWTFSRSRCAAQRFEAFGNHFAALCSISVQGQCPEHQATLLTPNVEESSSPIGRSSPSPFPVTPTAEVMRKLGLAITLLLKSWSPPPLSPLPYNSRCVGWRWWGQTLQVCTVHRCAWHPPLNMPLPWPP